MTLTNYAPVQNLNRIFDSLLDYTKSYLSENNGVYTLELELPGVKKEDISVNIEANLLKISAVRKRADEELKYEREYHISSEMDAASIKASNENGVLTLTLMRKPEAQSKQIKVA